jgi:hypothetical protein
MRQAASGMLATALLLLLAGCETNDPDLGMSVNRNVVAQAVDMNPRYAGVPTEGSNGKLAVAAQRRYLNGQVKPLLRVSAEGGVGQQGGASDAGGGAPAAAGGTGN